MLITIVLSVIGIIVASIVILALVINYGEAKHQRMMREYHRDEMWGSDD